MPSPSRKELLDDDQVLDVVEEVSGFRPARHTLQNHRSEGRVTSILWINGRAQTTTAAARAYAATFISTEKPRRRKREPATAA